MIYDEKGYTYLDIPLIIWGGDSFKITIWYAGKNPMFDNHQKFDIELLDNGETIFPRGLTYFSTPRFMYFDKPEELVKLAIECFTIAPGDTDPNYFDNYSDVQWQWLRSIRWYDMMGVQ